MITMKTNDEKKDLNLNPNIKHTNEKKWQKAKNKTSMKVSTCPPTKEPHWESSKMQLNYELTKNEPTMNIELNMNELWID